MEEVLIVAALVDRKDTVQHQIEQQVSTAVSKELLYLECSYRTPMAMMLSKLSYVSVMAVLQKLERDDMEADQKPEEGSFEESKQYPYAEAFQDFQSVLTASEEARSEWSQVPGNTELREKARLASVAVLAEFNKQLSKVQRLEAFLAHLHGVLVTSNPTAMVNAMMLAKEIEAFRKENK